MLVYLEAPGVAERSLALLENAQTQQDQVYYAFVLRNLASGWTTDQWRSYFGFLNIAHGNYRGGQSFQIFMQQIWDDAAVHLTAADRTALADVLSGANRVEAVKLETTRQFVHNWQLTDVAPRLDDVARGRSFESGRLAYDAAQCGKCHRFQDEGGATGPDITAVGARFNSQYILEAILTPDSTVSDQYRNSVVVTTSGEIFTGRIIDEDETVVKIRTSPFARELTEISKSQIDLREESLVSEMPGGLVNVLTGEEILDLIAYLRSGGNPADGAFTATADGESE
jgi:putative heme-binding domain-containing protein